MNQRCVLASLAGADSDAMANNIETQGCEVIRKFTELETNAMYRAVRELKPEFLVLVANRLSRLEIDEIRKVMDSCPLPVIVITDDRRSSSMRMAMEAGVVEYATDLTQAIEFQILFKLAAIRFDVQQEMRRKLNSAELKLAERKLVERAKGILMREKHCSEEEAYQELTRTSTHNGKPLVDIAAQIITSSHLMV